MSQTHFSLTPTFGCCLQASSSHLNPLFHHFLENLQFSNPKLALLSMAAFSYQDYPLFPLDSIYLPNTPTKNLSGFMEEGNINSTNCFSQFYPPETLHETPLDGRFHENSSLDHCSKTAISDNEPSAVTKKQSTESSTVVNKLESGEQVTQKVAPMDKKRKNTNGSTLTSAQSKVDHHKLHLKSFKILCSVVWNLQCLCFVEWGRILKIRL